MEARYLSLILIPFIGLIFLAFNMTLFFIYISTNDNTDLDNREKENSNDS